MPEGPALLALLVAAAPLPAQATHGTVTTAEFFSAALGARKRYLVYLPPSYAAATTRRYPAMYFLYGAWGSETDWINQGHLEPAATYCVPTPDYDSYIVRDLTTMVDAGYRTLADRGTAASPASAWAATAPWRSRSGIPTSSPRPPAIPVW